MLPPDKSKEILKPWTIAPLKVAQHGSGLECDMQCTRFSVALSVGKGEVDLLAVW